MKELFKIFINLSWAALVAKVGQIFAWTNLTEYALSTNIALDNIKAASHILEIIFIIFATIFVIGFIGSVFCALREVRKIKNNNKMNE